MPQKLKDFSSVSPSAKSLLKLKGNTNIPYAKQAAGLIDGGEIFNLNYDDKDFWFWMRAMHFESRYRSVDQLLKQTGNTNILELSSGYSFRGLDLCERDESIRYIDTDLPDVVFTKQGMIDALPVGEGVKGRFELLQLDVMDAAAFNDIVNMFGNGPLTIINEGLLMYLNQEEKVRLCSTILKTLKQRGGCWITADVYIKRPPEMADRVPYTSSERSFFEQHSIEDNKFESFESARSFFKSQGFEIVTEAEPDYQSLSVIPHLMKVLPEELRNRKEPPPKMQVTWMLKPR